MSNLVIKSKNDGELIAEIITNQNLTFDAAMELAGYIYCDGDPDGDPNATGWTIDHNTYWTQEDTDWGRDEYLTTNEIADKMNFLALSLSAKYTKPEEIIKMKNTFKTKVRVAKDNGREYGYKKEYIMIDVIVDNEITLHGMAEAKDDTDIKNARNRAIRQAKKDMGL
jgi:hypothetical protein